MAFKFHAMGDIKNRSDSEKAEAAFHRKLVALGVSKKMQGRIMGEFRYILKDLNIDERKEEND